MKSAGRAAGESREGNHRDRVFSKDKKRRGENSPAPSLTHLDPFYCTDEMHALTAILPIVWALFFAAPGRAALVVVGLVGLAGLAVVLQVLGITGCGPLCTGLG